MKKAFEWIKNNWILIVAGVAVVFMLWQRSVSEDTLSSIMKIQQEQTEAHLQEIKDLEGINKAKHERLVLLNETYKVDLQKLEEDYALLVNQIGQKSSKRRKKIVKEAKSDPTTLSGRIEDTFFIPNYAGDE